jgi:hypothetical protein
MNKPDNATHAMLLRQMGHEAAFGLLVLALARQAPNVARLIADFHALSEQHTIDAMNSTMPEPYFQEFGVVKQTLVDQLNDVAELRKVEEELLKPSR